MLRSRASLHLEVLALRHLRRILQDYLAHYHSWRCHQSVEMGCPEPRAVEPPEAAGEVAPVREAGGQYRHYERAAFLRRFPTPAPRGRAPSADRGRVPETRGTSRS